MEFARIALIAELPVAALGLWIFWSVFLEVFLTKVFRLDGKLATKKVLSWGFFVTVPLAVLSAAGAVAAYYGGVIAFLGN